MPSYELTAALRALRSFRLQEPQHVRWIERGYPNLTEEEYRAWFLSDYVKAKSKRRT